MDAQPEGATQAGERFAYFMVRIQTNADTRARSFGVVERLGTGRKESFESIEELVRLLTEGSADVQNMSTGTVAGNEPTAPQMPSQPARYEAHNNPLGDK
jgi:hypothetical protein